MKKPVHRPVRNAKRQTGAEPPAAAPPPDSHRQSELFEQGIRLLQAQEFQSARDCFEQASRGPVPEVAQAARVRALVCERRLAAARPLLTTAEDNYNYAVALMNLRRWDEAETYLERALAQMPRGDHLYYALALCRGWRGDVKGAYEFMKRAVELQPRNLIMARNDPDFAELGRQSPLREFLNPEQRSSQ